MSQMLSDSYNQAFNRAQKQMLCISSMKFLDDKDIPLIHFISVMRNIVFFLKNHLINIKQ